MLVKDAPVRSSRVAGLPAYYGWVVLAVGALGIVMTTPGQTSAMAVFLDPMLGDLGLPRATVSLLYTLGTLLGALAVPRVGAAIDRHGPRRAVAVIAALLAMACAGMSFVGNTITLLLGFTAVRGMGQGALGLVSVHAINLWFVRRRGFAMGWAGVGVACGTAFFPLLIQSLIARFGWRTAYALLGLLVALTILPLGAWLFRDRPERYGLLPDGHIAEPGEAYEPIREEEKTLEEARRTGVFWWFLAGGFVFSLLNTGLLFHHFAILSPSGLSREQAAAVFVPMAFVPALAGLMTGVLLDRFPLRPLLQTALVFLTATLLMATAIRSVAGVWLYGALFGAGQGMQGAILSTVWPYYFGRAHQGAIRGFASGVTVTGSALGPFVFALGATACGGFTPVLVAGAFLPGTAIAAAFFVRFPRR